MEIILTLSRMSIDEALKQLGLDAKKPYDETTVKKAYRDASKRAHPDLGGSKEEMQKVNEAYEMLKTRRGGGSGKRNSPLDPDFDWEEWRRNREQEDKKDYELGLRVVQELKNKLNVKAFTTYFSQVFGGTFSHRIISEYPKPTPRPSTIYTASVSNSFANEDESTVITFDVSASLTDIKYPKAGQLGFADISYSLMVTAYVYHDKRKHKLGQRDWKSTRDHVALKDPAKTFTKAKLNKIVGTKKKRKFAKRDMEIGLNKVLNSKFVSDSVFVPIGKQEDETFIQLHRVVFMRQPSWSIVGITRKEGYVYRNIDRITVSFPEEEETLNLIIDIQKKTKAMSGEKAGKAAKTAMKKAYEEFKKNHGI